MHTPAMQVLSVIIAFFGTSIWDLSANHGEFTRMGVSAALHVAHSVGLG